MLVIEVEARFDESVACCTELCIELTCPLTVARSSVTLLPRLLILTNATTERTRASAPTTAPAIGRMLGLFSREIVSMECKV